MTIGNDLDQAFYNLGQRITRLEKKEVAYPIENDFADRETVLGIEADLTSQIERLEAELNDRIDEAEGFDPDDLRCDLESQVEDLRDCISYESDRIDDLDCYKCDENEVRDVAIDVVREEVSDIISEFVESAVCEEVNSRAIGFTEWTILVDRVKELEDRLNKPSLRARVMRWLREGPSIKEVATGWYAGIRRGS